MAMLKLTAENKTNLRNRPFRRRGAEEVHEDCHRAGVELLPLLVVTMAKSLRSKWKRKMRAVKRIRYGEKEKARLEKMLKDFKEQEKDKEEEHDPPVLGE